jgi:hypothetical protein
MVFFRFVWGRMGDGVEGTLKTRSNPIVIKVSGSTDGGARTHTSFRDTRF